MCDRALNEAAQAAPDLLGATARATDAPNDCPVTGRKFACTAVLLGRRKSTATSRCRRMNTQRKLTPIFSVNANDNNGRAENNMWYVYYTAYLQTYC